MILLSWDRLLRTDLLYSVSLGEGPIKILMWSQMHGNETTTTKAVLDLISFFGNNDSISEELLQKCSLEIIPILNPDGAEAYTRVNANEIDLNRDARELSQPESKLLRKLYEEFRPNFCFNLHDQRTIFSAGDSGKPATVSFLAPACDEERSITSSRETSMQLIARMSNALQTKIPGQVGRYDDAFNPNCVGDSFQLLGTPTVLFEAGHAPGDYQRETTREYIFLALLEAIAGIASDELKQQEIADYAAIPENRKLFFDVLIHNAHLVQPKYEKALSLGIIYKEVLKEGAIQFEAYIETTGDLSAHFGHLEYDCLHPSDLENLKAKRSIYALLD